MICERALLMAVAVVPMVSGAMIPRQFNFSMIANRPCIGLVDRLYNVVQGVGTDDPSKHCGSSGDVGGALSFVTECMQSQNAIVPAVTTIANAGAAWCSSKINAAALTSSADIYFSASACCGTDVAAQSAASCPVTRTTEVSAASCTFFNQPRIFQVTGIAAASAARTSSATSTSARTSTPTPTNTSISVSQDQPSSTSNTGMVIGAAVGVTVGIVLIAIAILFVFLRRRRACLLQKLKAKIAAEKTETSKSEASSFKAQLHSDDVKHEIPELQSPVTFKGIKSVGGLEELDGSRSLSPIAYELPTDLDHRWELTSDDATTKFGSEKSGKSEKS